MWILCCKRRFKCLMDCQWFKVFFYSFMHPWICLLLHSVHSFSCQKLPLYVFNPSVNLFIWLISLLKYNHGGFSWMSYPKLVKKSRHQYYSLFTDYLLARDLVSVSIFFIHVPLFSFCPATYFAVLFDLWVPLLCPTSLWFSLLWLPLLSQSSLLFCFFDPRSWIPSS